MIHYRSMSGPLGDVLLRAEDGYLTGMFFSGQKYHPAGPFDGAPPMHAMRGCWSRRRRN